MTGVSEKTDRRMMKAIANVAGQRVGMDLGGDRMLERLVRLMAIAAAELMCWAEEADCVQLFCAEFKAQQQRRKWKTRYSLESLPWRRRCRQWRAQGLMS